MAPGHQEPGTGHGHKHSGDGDRLPGMVFISELLSTHETLEIALWQHRVASPKQGTLEPGQDGEAPTGIFPGEPQNTKQHAPRAR